MYRGPLPGFFWDEEKRKYFKVQPNHVAAAPSAIKYRKENVKKVEVEGKKRKREQHRLNQRKRHLIQHADALHSPSASHINIQDELGYTKRSKILDTRSEAFVRSLKPTVSLNVREDVSSQLGLIFSGRDYTIHCFDYDKETQGLLLGVSRGKQDIHESLLSVLPDDDVVYPRHSDQTEERESLDPRRPHYSFSRMHPVSVYQSSISSINLNSRTRTLITTSTGDRYPPTVQISQLVDPCNAISSQPLDSGVSSLFRPPNLTTIFTSRLNPWSLASNYEHIAVGTSNGIIGFVANSEGSRNWRSMQPIPTDSDVLALDWLSPSMLAAGMRDATVMLYDMRVRDGVKRMKHSGGVLALRRADSETRFICAGMNSQMSLYDLRMLKESDVPEPSIHKKRGSGTNLKTAARPLVKFQYNNQYDPLGLDVSEELRLVAAAEENGDIRISSLRTGESVKKFSLGPNPLAVASVHFEIPDDRVKCLRFVEDYEGVTKIMASYGPKIVEFAW